MPHSWTARFSHPCQIGSTDSNSFDSLQSNTTLNNIARLDSYSHGETGDQMLYCLLLSGLDFLWLYFCLLTPSAFPLTLFWSLPQPSSYPLPVNHYIISLLPCLTFVMSKHIVRYSHFIVKGTKAYWTSILHFTD